MIKEIPPKIRAAFAALLFLFTAGAVTTTSALSPPIINNPGDSFPPGSVVASLTPLFTWTQITGATGYGLYVWDASNNNLVFSSGSTQLTGSTYLLPSGYLQYGGSYYWAMISYAGTTQSTLSIYRYFQAPPPAPAAPVATAASAITISGFQANWSAVSGASGYRIDVSSSPNFSSYINNGQDVDVGNTTGATVAGLNSSMTYYYRVRAYNSTSTSDNSITIATTTLAYSLPVPTAQPASFITTSSFFANWSTVILALGYRVDISTTPTFTTFIPGGQDLDVGNNITTLISGLSANSIYYYRVRAYDNNGTSAGSATIKVTTLPNALNSPVANPATNVTGASFTASWGSVSGAASYRLDVSTTPTFNTYVSGYQNLNVGDVTSKVVTGLGGNNTYYYRVRAVAGTLTSGNSATITVTTLSSSLPPPTATAATAITPTTFTANWSSSVSVLGYRIDVSTNSNFSTYLNGWQNADPGNNTSVVVDGLNPSTTYYYRVREFDLSGTSANSATVSATTLQNPPSAPTANAATSVTNTAFKANWSSVIGATSYHLDVSTNNLFTGFVPGYQDLNVSNATSKIVTNLNPATTYYYRVRAYNVAGPSPNSGLVVVITSPVAPTPNAATAITNTSFVASWSASDTATTYFLDVSTSSTFSTYVTGYQNLNVGNVTSKTVTGLAANKIYYYRVRAYNGYGTSANSSTITLTTLPNPPTAPTALAATSVTNTSFVANWKSVTNATGYRLDISAVTNFSTYVSGYQDLDVLNVTNRAVTALTNGTAYFYRVRAYNATGTSGNSATIAVTTLPDAPLAPVALAATNIFTNRFNANWSGANGATGYRLDVSTNSAFSNFVSGYQNLDVGNVTTRAVSTLVADTTYYYRVRAYNAGGTSGNSESISVTTPPKPPAAPVATAATSITNNNFNANWNVSTGATGYRLDVSTSTTFSTFVSGYQNLDVGNVTTLNVIGLNGSTAYHYRVRAYGPGGASGNSATITATTLPNPPSAPTASAATSITASNFTANWIKITAATGYRLDVSASSLFDTFVAGFQDLNVSNVASKVVTGLTAGTTYFYRVRAYNTGGTSGNSATITTVTIPPAPTANPATAITSSGFTANWTAATGATGYRLDVATNTTFTSYVSGWQNRDVGNSVFTNVTALITNKFYYYRVRAYNASGTGGNSNTNAVKTLPPTLPTLVTTVQGSSLVLSWPTNDPGFKLYYATNVPATLWISNTTIPGIVAGQYAVTNSTADGTKFYRLQK